MNILTKLRIFYGSLCPEHHAPTYWDDDYENLCCSVTGKPVSHERKNHE